ncbi:MAG TPA: response regulator transcription factor [Candidatus Cybelea sp.]|nr:response regulator transcription factor [Candidatus Cybelea sp.]
MSESRFGTILIADRHAICRAGFRALLSEAFGGCRFVEADSLQGLLAAAALTADLDLILLDASLPGMRGMAQVSDVREAAPKARLVVISDNDRRDVIQAAFAHGAAGFIPKSVSPGVLIGALEVVMANGMYVPETLAHQTNGLDADTLAGESEPLPALTPRQREVLRLLVLGMRNKEIARQLELATGTVKVHVGSVLKTLGARNRTHAVAMARRLGLAEQTAH